MSRQRTNKKRSAPARRRATAKQPTNPGGTSLSRVWAWLGILIPLLLIVGLIAFGGGSDSKDDTGVGSVAPDFTLPTTTGTTVSLNDVLANGDEALLYFSMGVGCDGCFAQIPEIEDKLASMGITLVPIMIQPPSQIAETAARFGITGPILSDQDRRVSKAYNMLGIYGHKDRPSHSFALVGQDGKIKWVKHYATMFVPVDEFVANLNT